MRTSDHNVTETAFDAVKCKLSAATLGYFEDDFLQHFVPKPTRRIPLIHRGYYLRHIAIADCITRFLAADAGDPIQIVSLGAGFDTLFFRLIQQKARNLRFVEVDCDVIVNAKHEILTSHETLAALLPNATTTVRSGEHLTFQCYLSALQSSYALASCDLGDVKRLDSLLNAAGVDCSLPTLVLAECVVSYLDPARGTELLRYLSHTFTDATAVIYDPIALNDVFGATLQQYFAAKGCELRSLRQFQTPADHFRRFLRDAEWQSVRVVDMNGVFQACTTAPEKARIQALEAFDEYADWLLCNAHYAMFVASTSNVRATPWSHAFAAGKGHFSQRVRILTNGTQSSMLLRSYQTGDLADVQKLFQSTHLEYSCKAVKKFVNNRVRYGDLADVDAAFLYRPKSHFWVVETDDGDIVGCIGLKPLSGTTAEVCRLSVARKWRRCGLARLLVRVAEATATDLRYDAIHLETIESMVAAQSFYAAQGYLESAKREKFSTFTLVTFSKTLSTD